MCTEEKKFWYCSAYCNMRTNLRLAGQLLAHSGPLSSLHRARLFVSAGRTQL